MDIGDATGYSATGPLNIYGTLLKGAGSFHDTLYRPVNLSGGTISSADVGDTGAPFNVFGAVISTLADSGTSTISIPAGGAMQLRLNGSTQPLFNIGSNSTLTVNAVLTNFDASNPLTKTGLGRMVLNSNNVFTGITTIGSGVMSVPALANGGAASPIGASANAAANLVLSNAATLQYIAATNSTTDRAFTLGTGGGVFDVTNSAANVTFGGTATGAGGLTKVGPGTLTLTGRNTYSGNTIVSNGSLTLNSGNSTAAVIGTGKLTIYSGGRVDTAVNSFGYSDAKNSIEIIGGTLNAYSLDSHLRDVTVTAGTISSSGGEFRPHQNWGITNKAASTPSYFTGTLRLMDPVETFVVEDGAAYPDLVISGTLAINSGLTYLNKLGDAPWPSWLEPTRSAASPTMPACSSSAPTTPTMFAWMPSS